MGQEAWGHKNNIFFSLSDIWDHWKEKCRQPSFLRGTEHCRAEGRKTTMMV